MVYAVEYVKQVKWDAMAKHGKLKREQIVEVAIAILDRDGEAGFSMRKLARELGVDPMAIYHHHANRHVLIRAVIQAFLAQCRIPAPSDDWRADIGALCQSLRTLAKRHPSIFRLYETHNTWVPAESRIQEAFHAALQKAGFKNQIIVRSVRLLVNYTESFAVDEIAGWYDPFDTSDRIEFAATLSDDTHPAMMSLIDEIGAADADTDFVFGLDVIMRGMEAELG